MTLTNRYGTLQGHVNFTIYFILSKRHSASGHKIISKICPQRTPILNTKPESIDRFFNKFTTFPLINEMAVLRVFHVKIMLRSIV